MDSCGAAELRVVLKAAGIHADFFRYGILPWDRLEGEDNARLEVTNVGGAEYVRAKWGHTLDVLEPTASDEEAQRHTYVDKRNAKDRKRR